MLIDTNRVLRLSDIAEIAGVRPSSVSNWRKRRLGFPEPLCTIGYVAYGRPLELFDMADVLDWLERTGRLQSSPRPSRGVLADRQTAAGRVASRGDIPPLPEQATEPPSVASRGDDRS